MQLPYNLNCGFGNCSARSSWCKCFAGRPVDVRGAAGLNRVVSDMKMRRSSGGEGSLDRYLGGVKVTVLPVELQLCLLGMMFLPIFPSCVHRHGLSNKPHVSQHFSQQKANQHGAFGIWNCEEE